MLSTPRAVLLLCAPLFFILIFNPKSHGQSIGPIAGIEQNSSESAALTSSESTASYESLPPAPVPPSSRDNWNVAPSGTAHQQPLSRIGIGANVSPLGIGINATTVLTDFFDARLMGNFFSYTVDKFDIEGVAGTGNVHLASLAASLDWYPFNSVFRLSPGMMFYDGNRISMDTTSIHDAITIDGRDFYSATANHPPGSSPLQASALIGLHPHPVSFTLAGGFGRFVPHSRRHWSFPAEFGVVFMGKPTLDLNTTGWVCLDNQQTQCSDVSNLTDPVSQDFNAAVQDQLTKWRRGLGHFTIYPMFSYSVVYSFDIR
jgi:hypothetical protein